MIDLRKYEAATTDDAWPVDMVPCRNCGAPLAYEATVRFGYRMRCTACACVTTDNDYPPFTACECGAMYRPDDYDNEACAACRKGRVDA